MVFNSNLFNYFVYNQFGGKANNDAKWTTFSHNGVLFPDPYKPHKVPLIYDGKKIVLEPESEEYATIYAKFIDTEYVNNKIFNKNFFADWKPILKKGGHGEINQLDKCDFSLIRDHILKYKEAKANLSTEEKAKIKEKKDKFEEKFKVAIVDGKEQPTGNFRIEPPGIFLGRGCHPLAGKIKERVFPEDIIINIDSKSPVPQMPSFYSDRKWKDVIHDNTLEWLASWKDTITGKMKYVWLGAKSDFKAKSDQFKFDLARKLKTVIGAIRRTNFNNITSSSVDSKTKQLATALYLIDNLALRVGNEKGDDEADTVGVCSLRVEHVKLLDDNKIKLDFLGKDSVRYVNTVQIQPEVYRTLATFINNKKPSEELFDEINPALLNSYLKTMMEDLTAKVFRTYNASKLFQEELDSIDKSIEKLDHDDKEKINLILDMYVRANIKVAMMCNHQKNVSKSFNEQIEKLNDKIRELKIKKKELESMLGNETNKEKRKKIKEKIGKVKSQIQISENKKDLKIELKSYSLTTSKTNYIDPRITVAFFKKHNLPLEQVFTKALIDKFFWAMDVPTDWKF
jgi:DNA topoisomerase-1